MKIAIVLGTRPEILKLAPIIFELEKQNINYFTIHTGQHYSENMDKIFWDSLQIPIPKYLLKVRETSHAHQTAEMLKQISEIYLQESPTHVIVQGDTNSTLSGALAASKMPQIKIAHLEAGLRSFDRTMPEEINRIIVDHISHYLLAPTSDAVSQLTKEGFTDEKCFNVGNTVEDMLWRFLPQATTQSRILQDLEVSPKDYILLTAHRQENTQNITRLHDILSSVFETAAHHNLKVIFPIHPRTRNILSQLNLPITSNIKIIDPVGYFDFLILQKEARVIATDSGGVQEESCILGVPCITLRENTERPETIRLGANQLVGVSPDQIKFALEKSLSQSSMNSQNWTSPYGKGTAAQRTIEILLAKS